jgi:uncharacterized protein (TIGR02246 family)
MDGFMTALDSLQAQACRDLIVEAAHCLDSRDWAAFAECFAEDGVLIRPGGEPIRSRQEIEAVYRSRDPQRITQHLLLNQRVQPIHQKSGNELRAHVHSKVLLWTSHDSQALTAKGRAADPQQQIGEFQDELVYIAGQWKITQRQASFLLFQAFSQ